MDMTSVFAEITKTAPQADGSLLVYGKATGSDLDMDQQRCDPEWLDRAMPEWFRGPYGGNLREQHDPKRAVGKATEHEVKDDGHWITAKVVDPIAKAKVEAGVLSGFSIGISRPRIEKSTEAANGVITDGKIIEVSLVDRPCLPTAMFTMCKAAKPGMSIKADDFDSDRMLVRVEELTEKPVEKAAEPEVEKEMTVSIAEQLAPEQVEQLEAAVEKKTVEEKTTTPEVVKADGAEFHYSREIALELVKAADNPETATNILAGITVPPTAPPPEINDILRAKAAIAIIGQLIQGEAMNLATRPYQDCDIELLMQAVQALRCFMCREKNEPGNGDGTQVELAIVDQPADKAAGADVEKAKYSAEELRQMLKDGKAFKNPNGDPSYPIADKEDLENAIHAVGRGSGDHDAIRAYIARRAKALGAADMLPDSWTGSSKAVEPEEVKTVEFAEKAAEPETTKAAVEIDGDALAKAVTSALEKAFSADELQKAENPINKTFTAIVEASTGAVQKSVSDLAERLATVEQMAVPGGPVLRRTETERKQSRINDLNAEVMRYKALSNSTEDRVLRKGYAQKAAALEAEIKAL